MSAAAATQGLSKSGQIFFGSLCASTFGLGCWQSKRYFEKIEQVDQRNIQLQMTPVALEKDAKCSIEEQYQVLQGSGGKGKSEGEVQVKVASVSDGEDRGYTPLIVKGTFRYVTCTLLYGDWQYGFIKALRVVQST